ncbi:MAG: long-chain-fatty-acid--CoA ligase [Ferroplasma sp.]|uniref:long-chain-fatty-acid--CoA ligase n=1 Tax=Ferroplasma sp. TaxID=2591003 RepID=UPI00281642E3|nr:long-chain-fatty-acid--CoA ligase [Ferroplasma sp.]WMT52061.1 MAG: long-chain-fatty-acid--CoA ligase [Ferroplasma sp.]
MVDFKLTINNLLDSAVRSNGDQQIVYRDNTLTYKSFAKNVKNFAANLRKIGVKPGDRIAVLDYDTINYLYCYYSIPMIGAVIHMVNIRYPPEVLYYTVKNSEDSYLVVNADFMPLILQYKDMFDFIKGFIVYSEKGHEKYDLNNVYYADSLLEDAEYKEVEPDENSMATLFYTSGTTGLPKGVYYSHKQLVLHSLASSVALSDEPIALKRTAVMLPLVPMFHVHAWGIPYFTIMRGIKYVLPGKYEWDRIIETMEREKVTNSAMVPSILYLLLQAKRGPEVLGKLKLKSVIGGAALNEGLAKTAESLGMTVVTGYGMSETGPILTLANYSNDIMDFSSEKKQEYRRKTGIPVPFVDLRVVSDGEDVEKNNKEIGEIIVRAPWLTQGYIKDQEKTSKLWKDGWLHTGDLATMDEYGYVKIVDRESDAVKSGGEFIPSMVLEDLISTVPGVGEVAVTKKPDEKWGERPVAFIKGTASREDIENEMKKYVETGRIAKFWLPDDYIFVDEFEKTGTGKIDKKVLRKKLE